MVKTKKKKKHPDDDDDDDDDDEKRDEDQPRHPLDETLPKMVEGDGDLHVLVKCEAVVVPEQHDLVVLTKMVVRDGDRCGTIDSVH